jgi:hypothetical protein
LEKLFQEEEEEEEEVFGGKLSWRGDLAFLGLVLLVSPLVVVWMAAVPFAARALVGTLPEAVLVTATTTPITLKEMIEDFMRQLPEVATMLENVMQSGAATFVIHCKETRHAEGLLHSGLTFRSHPVKLVPAPNTQWVKLTRVVYGTTENAIKSRLGDYGTVLKIRRELIHGIGISTYSVKLELRKPIPSRITIANHPVNVFYRGQIQQCFRCEQTGHLSKSCPFKRSSGVPAVRIVGDPVVVPPVQGTVDVPVAPGGSASDPPGNDPPADDLPVDDPPAGDPPVDDPPTDDPPADDPPVDDPPVCDPAMDVSSSVPVAPSATLASSSSSSTSVNPDTGKRQRGEHVEQSPAKKDKIAVPSYETCERELLRVRLLRSKGLSDDDKRVMAEMNSRIPLERRITYHQTCKFRHPTWWLSSEDEACEQLLADICSLKWPDYCVDLSSSDLLAPILPPQLPPPALPYWRYDRIRTFLEARKKFPSVPDLHPDVQRELDGLDGEVLQAYRTFYSSTHPECMEGIADETRDAILRSFIDRTHNVHADLQA